MRKLTLNRKAQISQTLVWVLATILIVGILVVSVLLSFVIAKSKTILEKQPGEVKAGFESEFSVLEMKTNLAYQLNSDNKDKIKIILEEKE